ENISFDRCASLVGDDTAAALRDLSLAVYSKAADYAATRGIIIADTKFEFGVHDGRIVLGDEVLTPDSSRFWASDGYAEGSVQPSFDKQFVRNWLNENWARQGNPPRLPADVIEQTSAKYIQAYEMITGQKF
ncbi:MAG: phosphoribosylaminoimidazolesuccinocarboxamide synthase, partial [Eggerthellaceae bacterium]|nr:phosphoribosylaminoimidazolesuccinocarboxamide synthase [Eggerthellaceae bacterium]